MKYSKGVNVMSYKAQEPVEQDDKQKIEEGSGVEVHLKKRNSWLDR